MARVGTLGYRPAGGDPRSIGSLLGNFDQILAQVDGNLDTTNMAAGGIGADALGDAARLGLNGAAVVRRGKSIVAAAESRTNVAYGFPATPDRVQNVVIPTDALLCVMFAGVWQESVVGAGKAAIFIGANQLKAANFTDAAPAVQETGIGVSPAPVDKPLVTCTGGLTTNGGMSTTVYTGDVTTGQVVGALDAPGGTVSGQRAGACWIDNIAAGTYDISVQYKSTSGSVTVKNRRLKIFTLSF